MNVRKIDDKLKLIPYYPNDEVSLSWYQDPQICKQVDNIDEIYSLDRLHRMYDYLCRHGDCYYIQYHGNLIGDVSLRNNCEIAIVISKQYQNLHIGRRCVLEMLKLAKEKGMQQVTANIFPFNKQSQKMFRSVGFQQRGEECYVYELFGSIKKQLFDLQDKKYQTFQSKLMPTVTSETIIGVRIPLLRKFAKELSGTEQAESFMNHLPHEYYEENNLHAFLIERIKDYDSVIAETERFLPYIDNWATCDCFCPKVFAKYSVELLVSIQKWLNSDRIYTVRFAIGMLMRYYLDDNFQPEYLAWVKQIQSDEYYVNMMRAWYFATALAKQPDTTFPLFSEKRLDVWTHNKAIQKAIESYRISAEMKNQLRGLRIHKK